MHNTEQLASQQTRDMEHQLSTQVHALYWSKEKLLLERQLRLQKLLAHAKMHSPWYRSKLQHIDVDNFTEERLEELPVLTKSTLMENWDTIVTQQELSLNLAEKHVETMLDDENLLYLLNRYHVIATSGSSGKRGVFIYDWNEWNTYYLMFRRFPLYFENKKPVSLFATKKITIGVVAASSAVHGMYSLAKTFTVRNSETFHFPITLPLPEIIAGLNQTQPDVLQGAPTTLYKLCKAVTQGELRIHPKVISVGGEAFYPIIREALTHSWPNAAIFNSLGTSEGLAGVTCTAHRKEMHLNDDLCIVEPVNNNGKRVTVGELSDKIFITNLFNYTLPLIRYEITDRICFLDKICDCGVAHQLIEEPQSRFELDFIYENEVFVHHVTFVSPLLHEKNIQEYQVVQTTLGAEIRIVTTGQVNVSRLQSIIEKRLNVLGIEAPVVTFTEVPAFTYPFSGKLKRFIALERA